MKPSRRSSRVIRRQLILLSISSLLLVAGGLSAGLQPTSAFSWCACAFLLGCVFMTIRFSLSACYYAGCSDVYNERTVDLQRKHLDRVTPHGGIQ